MHDLALERLGAPLPLLELFVFLLETIDLGEGAGVGARALLRRRARMTGADAASSRGADRSTKSSRALTSMPCPMRLKTSRTAHRK